MTGEGSFLDRVRYGEVRDELDVEVDESEVARSVCRNLERIFNAWTGSALIDLGLGMPDDAYHAGSAEEIGRNVAGHLTRNVKNYEPRLGDIRVRPMSRGGEAHGEWVFELDGRLVSTPRRPRVRLSIRRDANRYRVVF